MLNKYKIIYKIINNNNINIIRIITLLAIIFNPFLKSKKLNFSSFTSLIFPFTISSFFNEIIFRFVSFSISVIRCFKPRFSLNSFTLSYKKGSQFSYSSICISARSLVFGISYLYSSFANLLSFLYLICSFPLKL